MKEYIEAGEFVTTHGVTGELRLYPWCDGPEFIAALPRLFFSAAGARETKLESVRPHKGMCIIRLAGVNDMDTARTYVRKIAYFARADVHLPEGRYFVQDILGCLVKDADTGAEYGTVTAVTHPAASDVYEITDKAGTKHLFPAVPEFLVALKPEESLVLIRPIPGMFTPADEVPQTQQEDKPHAD